MSKGQLKALLGVSDSLASLNFSRYKNFDKQADKQAMWLYSGPAFKALSPQGFGPKQIAFAQAHLRILSGLYGLLRPCDGVRPYRLDMGKKLKVHPHSDLYSFWKGPIAQTILADTKASKSQESTPAVVVSCASNEYFKAVDASSLSKQNVRVVVCSFKEPSGRTISVYAKRARGLMCRWHYSWHIFKLCRAQLDLAFLSELLTCGQVCDRDRSSFCGGSEVFQRISRI
jgi:uncharacterized protein